MAHNKHMLVQANLETQQLQLALQMAEEARDLYERLGMTRHLVDIEELLQKLPGNNSDSEVRLYHTLVTFISPHISAATPFTKYANVLISPTRNVSFTSTGRISPCRFTHTVV